MAPTTPWQRVRITEFRLLHSDFDDSARVAGAMSRGIGRARRRASLEVPEGGLCLLGRHPVWQMGPRVVASHLLAGRMPKALRAYTWRPAGLVAGCRSVELPGGIAFSPQQRRRRVGDSFNDLACAISEMVLRAKAGSFEGIDPLARERLGGSGKVARNGIAYGQAVEFNLLRGRSDEVERPGAVGPEGGGVVAEDGRSPRRGRPGRKERQWTASTVPCS